MNAYKPDGYSSVSPYLVVEGADKLLAFLVRVFDAEVTRKYERADGAVMHAELKIDDSVVMISEATEHWPAAPATLHAYVPDADESYRRALAAGGEPIKAPAVEEGDPDKRGMFKDFAGNVWAVGTQQ